MSSAEPIDAPGLARHEDAGLTRDDLLVMYRYMLLTRSLEEYVRRLYLQGRLQGAVYSSSGQEGTAVASAYALGPDDFIAPLIRDLGASITRGMEPWRVFAQWLGRMGGPTDGRDGNLHFGDLSHRILAPISMLGATIPLCAGVALAGLQRNESRVVLAYIGDGGTDTGDFHEGMNLAAVLRLPLVVIIEDNGFAYSTPVATHAAIETMALRADIYGVPGMSVDGNDVVQVYAATRAAVERARAGGGPTVIEAKTFRMRGHAEHDDASYVPPSLLEQWSRRDPIARLSVYLERRALLTADERAGLDGDIERTIVAALERAEAQPLPDPTTQTLRTYAP